MKMTLSTIQPMGKRPYPAPRTAVAPAMRAGMWKAKMAMSRRDGQARQRGVVRLHMKGQSAQQDDHGHGSDQGGEPPVPGGVVALRPRLSQRRNSEDDNDGDDGDGGEDRRQQADFPMGQRACSGVALRGGAHQWITHLLPRRAAGAFCKFVDPRNHVARSVGALEDE